MVEEVFSDGDIKKTTGLSAEQIMENPDLDLVEIEEDVDDSIDDPIVVEEDPDELIAVLQSGEVIPVKDEILRVEGGERNTMDYGAFAGSKIDVDPETRIVTVTRQFTGGVTVKMSLPEPLAAVWLSDNVLARDAETLAALKVDPIA